MEPNYPNQNSEPQPNQYNYTATPPQQQQSPSSQPQQPTVQNPLEAMRPGEEIICVIKRHPIGILGAYITSILLFAGLAVVGYAFVPKAFPDHPINQVYGVVTLVLLLVGLLIAMFVVVTRIVYWGNRWIVTDDSITQVTQTSLFSKQSAQLSLANLEDITAEQNGLLPQMFNYGIIWAETAGEKDKFRFPYCPDPNGYARKILEARENFQQGKADRD